MASPELDLVLFGATGFTGRLTAQRLLQQAPPGLRWALAGRSEAGLLALRSSLGPQAAQLPIIVADGLDRAAIEELVARTAGVISAAGPFEVYSDHLLTRCAHAGVDYVDISAETPWILRKINELHGVAHDSGARIINFCGFDSVPSDLGVLLLARRMRAEHGQGLARVRLGFSIRGGVNGGTLATMQRLMEPEQMAILSNLNALTPTDSPSPLDTTPDQTDARWDEDLQCWTAPFIMELINSRVVRRSAALYAQAGQPYGAHLRYSGALCLKGAAAGLTAMGISGGMMLTRLGAPFAPLRSLFRSLSPAPGEGPTEKTLREGKTAAVLVWEGEAGQRLTLRMRYAGDPGNLFTTAVLVECALALRLNREQLPSLGGGLHTPATGIGELLAQRLLDAGVDISFSGT